MKPLLHPCLEEVCGALQSMLLPAEPQEELAGACCRLEAFLLLFVARQLLAGGRAVLAPLWCSRGEVGLTPGMQRAVGWRLCH